MITLKINMLELKCSVKTMNSKSGPMDCLVIPISLNNLYTGEKGIYLDMIAFEMKNPKEGQGTHLVKQSLPKEVRDKMTEDEVKAIPILGNMRITDSFQQKDPVSNPTPQGETDDLPFSLLLPIIGTGLFGLLSNFHQIIS